MAAVPLSMGSQDRPWTAETPDRQGLAPTLAPLQLACPKIQASL